MSEKLEINLNWFDRTIGFFSPRTLLKRQKAKLYTSYLKRKYEGASSGRRTDGWNTSSSSAASEIASGQVQVRNRSRDLIRNNPYAARGIQVISNNVVGKGITTQIMLDTKSTKSLKEKRVNEMWRAWANTTAIDFDGVHNIFGLQRIIMRAVPESGEVLIRIRRIGRRFTTSIDGRKIELPPIQLQILENDFIANNQVDRTLPNGNVIMDGIEFDRQGRKVAYHLFLAHPGNSTQLELITSFNTVRVPAEDILQPLRVDRPGQFRGMPWLAPVMIRLRDFDLYEDAQLKRQQCAAMFTAFVHDMEGVDDAQESKDENELGEKMEPGLIELLPPGKSIEFADPPGADNYKEYTSVVLHSIASGLGITFESMTGDLSEVNFSSARMGFLEMQRNFDSWGHNIMINQVMRPVFNWFKNAAALVGPSIDNAQGVFTLPRREMIDPTKEVAAMKTAVRSGFKTLSSAASELGLDPDTHFEQYQKDNETLDKLNLVFDSDPRKRDNGGSSNEESPTGNKPAT